MLFVINSDGRRRNVHSGYLVGWIDALPCFFAIRKSRIHRSMCRIQFARRSAHKSRTGDATAVGSQVP
jgi:hypothetical protein